MWKSISSLLFTILHLLFIILAGFFMLAWQQQEHKDNTFKLYKTLPISIFSALLIRFLCFYFICCLVFLPTLFLSIKIIEWVWIERYADYASIIHLNPSMWNYLTDCLIALLFFPSSTYFLIYILSLKVKNISVSAIIVTIICILNFLPLPYWFFFSMSRKALGLIRLLHSDTILYTFQNLWEMYFYNLFCILLLLIYLFFQRKRIF